MCDVITIYPLDTTNSTRSAALNLQLSTYLLPEDLPALPLLRAPNFLPSPRPPSPPERLFPALEGLADRLDRSGESLLNDLEDFSPDRSGAAPLSLGLDDLLALDDLAPLLLEAPRGFVRLMPRSVLRDSPLLLRPSSATTGLRVRAPDRPPSFPLLNGLPRRSTEPSLLSLPPLRASVLLLLLAAVALSASTFVALLREMLYSKRF